MKIEMNNSQRGFSLLELMIASVIGLLVIGAMTSLFKMGMDATFTITQRAETQENMRAAIELMTKDLSLAGAGLPTGGLQLPTGGGATLSRFGCNQAGTCYVPTDTYPASGGTTNYMFGIIPGYKNGVENNAVIAAAPASINDSVTSVYCDYNYPLSNFTFSFPVTATQASVAVINPAVWPNNILSAGGLQPGDLLLFILSTPGNGTTTSGTSLVQNAAAVAEITSIPSNTTINFAAGDALNFNQSGAGITNNLAGSIGTGTQMTVCRLNVVTYFIEVPAAGGTVQTPRLMRQVNGQNAIPVADNIINLQFTYDVIDSTTGFISANQVDPIGAGLSPGLIQKVNIWIMGQGLTTGGTKAQNMYLATSVSASNMSFCNAYASTGASCQ